MGIVVLVILRLTEMVGGLIMMRDLSGESFVARYCPYMYVCIAVRLQR